jgi:hypothetical protein
MSYDLVLWRGANEAQNLTWARLRDGETVAGLAPFSASEVRAAFERVFGADLRVAGQDVLGHGFELRVGDDKPYLQICCAWGSAQSEEGRAVLEGLRRVAEVLGATVFDPQTATAPSDPGLVPIPAELPPEAQRRPVDHAQAGEDRAQSFARVELWEATDSPGEGVHALYLRNTGDGKSREHAYHPKNLAGVQCRYARLVQTVFPFDIVVASGTGESAEGTRTTFGNRVLALNDGKAGFLESPVSTTAREDGEVVSCWSRVRWAATGPLATRRGPTVDLTGAFDDAARRALAAAQAGNTRPLRDWMVLLAALDAEGRAAEELLAMEVPAGPDVARAFEAFDSGAQMPVWCQRQSGTFRLEARLRLPEAGGFTFKLIPRDKAAAQRHTLEPPLGADR